MKLQPKRTYKHHRPMIKILPIHIIIVDEHTLLTVRPYTTMKEQNTIFDEFIESLRESASANNLLSLANAKTLAVELLDEVSEQNWLLRDTFKDWKKTLNNSIREHSDAYY